MSRRPSILIPTNLDWSQPDAVIAAQLGCQRWWINYKRRQLGYPRPTQRKPYTRTKP